jgi:single-strand DNA-binding protein
MSVNKVFISGNLVKDPELRYSPNQLAILDGTIANNRQWTKDGEKVTETCFIDFVVFGKQAEYYAERIGKGKQVTIEGQLKQDTWEREGQKRSKHKLTVQEIVFEYPKNQPEASQPAAAPVAAPAQAAAPAPQVNTAGSSEDDRIPF